MLSACGAAETQLLAELSNPMASSALNPGSRRLAGLNLRFERNRFDQYRAVAFRRELARNESERIRRQLNDVYSIGDGHWYPLAEGSRPEHAIAFHTDFLVHMNEFQLLREVSISRGFLGC